MEPTTRIFVYGSLKKGYINNERYMRDGAKYVRHAIINGYTLHQHPHGYPVMFPDEQGIVFGEIWAVDDWTLESLDYIEYGSGYERKIVDTIEGNAVDSYVYTTIGRKLAEQQGFVHIGAAWSNPEYASSSDK
jgi:gamma-glutamylcyclotransferase (GGCT)/AIG2-like uncharacterized protein YtfP